MLQTEQRQTRPPERTFSLHQRRDRRGCGERREEKRREGREGEKREGCENTITNLSLSLALSFSLFLSPAALPLVDTAEVDRCRDHNTIPPGDDRELLQQPTELREQK